MKKFSLYTLALMIGVFTIFSCSEKDRAFPEFGDDDVLTGAYPRLVEGVNGHLDYEHPNNPDSSSLSFVVEFYDVNQGRDAASYSWSATYGTFGPTVVKTYTAADFVTNADGLPQLSATITFDEIFNALGMTIADFELTQDFLLDATLTLNDGRSFSFANSGSNVVGQPTHNALFRHVPAVIKKPCNSVLAGTFDAKVKVAESATVAVPGTWGGCVGNEWTGEVRFEEEHDPATFDAGVYRVYSTDPVLGVELADDASMGAYYGCPAYGIDATGGGLPLGDVRVTESCGKMGFSGASQWGEVWIFTKVEVDGPTLILHIENDYGEAAEVELTRQDLQPWQTDLFCDGC